MKDKYKKREQLINELTEMSQRIAELEALEVERKRVQEDLKKNLSQLSKWNRYEKIINTVTQSVHQSINLQNVLENAVEVMNENIDVAKCVSIYLVEGEKAVIKAYRGLPTWFIERAGRIPYPKGFTWKTIIEGRPTYCANIDEDKFMGPAGRELGAKSYLCIPIKLEGKTVGTLCIHSMNKNPFDEEELSLLEIVAHRIEAAINNARQAEALRQSEERYHTLFDQSPVGVFIFDKEFKITQCNERMVEILKSSRDKIEGLDMRNLKDQSFMPTMQKALDGEIYHKEGFYVATTSSEKLWLSVRVSPLLGADGNVIGGLTVVEDITKRKRAEKALADEKERLAVTLRSIGDAVITTDTERKVVLINKIAEEVTGWTQEEAIGKPLFEIFYIVNEKSLERLENPVEKVLKFGGMVGLTNQTVLIARDGRERIIADSGAPIRDRESNIVGVVLVFRDITEQRKMEEELLKAQKLESLGVLAGGIAHDFNNLLTAIVGNISLIKIYGDPDDRTSRRLIEAEKACMRATDLTGQLLTFSKGGVPVKKVVSSLDELIRDTANFAVSGSNVRCEFMIDDDPSTSSGKVLWPVEIDEGQISQVIHNLVINADHAMPEGGMIRVKIKNVIVGDKEGVPLKKGKYLRIEIEDKGVGIAEEDVPKIFDPYFTTKEGGSGIGLATAYSIIKKHDGYIGVESKIGVGTKFYIFLPAVEEKLKRIEQPERGILTGSGRVLLMDDEKAVRETAGEMLKHIGYEVEFARDGKEAIEIYIEAKKNNRPFDLVIMDLTIAGGIGGKETIKNLLEIDPLVKAIVSSGYSNDPVMSEYEKYGFKGVVTKPYKIEKLSKTLHGVLNQE